MEILRRFLKDSKVEIRKNDDDKRTIRGYGAVFDKRSEDMGFIEIIAPGAFDDVLSDDVRGLWNHDSNIVLGRTVADTMRIGVDKRGLWYEIDPPSWADGHIETVDRGDVSQSSFGFSIAESGDELSKEGDNVVRTITKIGRLFDVSPVAYPAYPDTESEARSLMQRAQDMGIISVGRSWDEGERARELELMEMDQFLLDY